MRRIVLILVAALTCSVVSHAQLSLGGSFGLSNKVNGRFSVYIAPEISYSTSSYFTLGGRFIYRSGDDTFGVNPYLRWHIIGPSSPVRLLATIHAPMTFRQNYFGYGCYFQPGISIRLASTVFLQCHVGAFGWGGYKSAGQQHNKWSAVVNADNISVGIVFSI